MDIAEVPVTRHIRWIDLPMYPFLFTYAETLLCSSCLEFRFRLIEGLIIPRNRTVNQGPHRFVFTVVPVTSVPGSLVSGSLHRCPYVTLVLTSLTLR